MLRKNAGKKITPAQMLRKNAGKKITLAKK